MINRWRTFVTPAMAAMMLAGVPAAAQAETRYVTPAGGAASGACASPATACTYAYALEGEGSAAGDTVILLRGSYDVSANEIVLERPLNVVGEGGGPRPVVTSNVSNGTTFQIAAGGADSTISHLEVRATNAGGASALLARGRTASRDLHLESTGSCAALQGSGSSLTDTTATQTLAGSVEPCVFAFDDIAPAAQFTLRRLTVSGGSGPNAVIIGPGTLLEDSSVSATGWALAAFGINNSPAVIRRSTFSGGGAMTVDLLSGAVLTDSVVTSTASNATAVLGSAGTSRLRNVTAIASGPGSVGLGANGSSFGGIPAGCTAPASVEAKNVIARGGAHDIQARPAVSNCTAPGMLTISFSNFVTRNGPVTDAGSNQTVDPLFANPAGGDFHLRAGSPAIDAGTADSSNGPSDREGRPRTFGAAPDIGAFEFTPPPLPASDTIAPALRRVGITNKVFADTGKPTAKSAAKKRKKKAKRGTTFRYTLSEPGRISISIQRALPGRRKGKRCVNPTRKLRKAKRCTRYKRVGTLNRDAPAGANRTRFSGRIGRKRLKFGKHRSVITATDAAGNRSRPKAVTFKFVRR